MKIFPQKKQEKDEDDEDISQFKLKHEQSGINLRLDSNSFKQKETLCKKQSSNSEQFGMFKTFYKTSMEQRQSPLQKQKLHEWINNILHMQYKNKTVTYFIPVYLRMKIKNIISIDFDTFKGKVNAAMLLSIYYGDLPEQIVKHIKSSTFLNFSKGTVIKLDGCKTSLEIDYKDKKEQQIINFTIRDIFKAYIQCDVFWSPFQILQMVLSIEINCRSFILNGKKIKIKYNFMDCEDEQIKFSTTQERDFGAYKMAQKLNQVQYSNIKVYTKSQSAEVTNLEERLKNIEKTDFSSIRIIEEQKELLIHKKLSSFKHAHFALALYKRPLPSVFKIYFPLLLLGIINLGIFYQQPKASGKKMINIGALMISYIALLPTIRQSILESRKISIMQILVFSQAFTSLFSMIQTVQVRNQQRYEQDGSADGLFLISLIITTAVFVVVVILTLVHYLLWVKRYHKKPEKNFKFSRVNWHHAKCSQYFEKIKHKFNIKVYHGQASRFQFIDDVDQNEEKFN